MIDQEMIETARNVDIITLVPNLKRATQSGEYKGPCPMCGGKDRFTVKNNRWFCRKHTGEPEAGKPWHDTIDLIKDWKNMSFAEAVAYLADKPAYSSTSRPKVESKIPTWHTNYRDLLGELTTNLLENKPAMTWLAARGINQQTVVDYQLGYANANQKISGVTIPDRGITIPHLYGKKLLAINIRRAVSENAGNRYYYLPGSLRQKILYNAQSLAQKNLVFIAEGELDTILLARHVSDFAAVISLASSNATLDSQWFPLLLGKKFIIVTDNDESGHHSADYWLSLVGANGLRALPPIGKDVSEAHQQGVNLRQWAQQQAEPYRVGQWEQAALV